MATNQEDVKLLGVVGSPFVLRAEIALKFKGIEYTFVNEDLANKSELLLKSNPAYKKVPVFFHNENPISDSLVILEYIDETWKQNPIFPSDPYQKALARFWSQFIDDKIGTYSFKAVYAVHDEKEREKNVEEATKALQTLENELKGKFFGGEEIGFLDIAAVLIAFWIPLVQEVTKLQLFTEEKCPRLYKWSKEFLNHPVVKEIVPSSEPLLAHLKAKYDIILASK